VTSFEIRRKAPVDSFDLIPTPKTVDALMSSTWPLVWDVRDQLQY